MAKLKVEFRNPESLIPYVKNSKVHTKEQINKVAGAISAFGFNQPIVVDKEGVIIAGHCRREAAIALALKEVPVIVASHLDEYQVMAARIADNKVAESAWDPEMLKFDLGTLKNHDFNLELTGFDLGSVNAMLDFGDVGDLKIGSVSDSHSTIQHKEPINFFPASENEQSNLDEKKKNKIQCPNCGENFDVEN